MTPAEQRLIELLVNSGADHPSELSASDATDLSECVWRIREERLPLELLEVALEAAKAAKRARDHWQSLAARLSADQRQFGGSMQSVIERLEKLIAEKKAVQ